MVYFQVLFNCSIPIAFIDNDVICVVNLVFGVYISLCVYSPLMFRHIVHKTEVLQLNLWEWQGKHKKNVFCRWGCILLFYTVLFLSRSWNLYDIVNSWPFRCSLKCKKIHWLRSSGAGSVGNSLLSSNYWWGVCQTFVQACSRAAV